MACYFIACNDVLIVDEDDIECCRYGEDEVFVDGEKGVKAVGEDEECCCDGKECGGEVFGVMVECCAEFSCLFSEIKEFRVSFADG